MDDRQRLTDERLEAELRSLPELDPPVDLVSRVMEQVVALDGDLVSDLPSGPKRRRARPIPVWQPVAAVVSFAAIIVFVALRYAGTSLGLLRSGVEFAAHAVHFVSDRSIAIIAGGWAWFAKAAVMASVFGNVVRTVAGAVVSEFAPLITVAVAAAIVLQFALFAIAGRRSEMS